MRSIFGKLFLWFWGASFFVGLVLLLVTLLTGAPPLRLWVMRTCNLHANSAVEAYRSGGTAALDHYLDAARRDSLIDAELIDPAGRKVNTAAALWCADRVIARVQHDGRSRYPALFRLCGAVLVPTSNGNFIFAIDTRPFRQSLVHPGMAMVKFLTAMLTATLLCLLLARHLSAPIRQLQTAARNIANGNLGARAAPLIGDREDELGELARDFDRMAEQIQSLLRQQQELLGEISHELRSPLARLRLSVELARRGESDALDRAGKDIRALDELIGEILTLTRVRAIESSPCADSVDLNSLVASIVADAQFETSTAGKTVVLDAEPGLAMQGDSGLLRSGIENCIRNAIRFTPAGAEVRVGVHRVAQAAQISIADEGEGVPEESLAKLFQPFYRVPGSGDRHAGGIGLGLAIAERVVRLHHGSISAQNRPGGGLVLKLEFPLNGARSQ